MNTDLIKSRIHDIQQRITSRVLACGREPGSVRLVAVSKTRPDTDIRKAAQAGVRIFGENYIQESIEKIDRLKDLDLSFHFIGHLQSNKARFAVPLFDLIHSVDSLKLAQEIDRQARKISKIQAILVQVNISMEESKSGISEKDALTLVKQISNLENITICGLMTLPPHYNEPEKVKPYFKSLRMIRDRIRDAMPSVRMDELSMGMTGDFEAAIDEGATLVRIGTALFGERS